VSSCFKTTELSVERTDNAVWQLDLIREEEAERKDKLITRLCSEGEFDLAAVLQGCGQDVWIACTECLTRKRVHTACKKRWCPSCAPKLAADRVRKFQAAVLAMKWPLHVTLTMANVKDLSRSTLVKLLKNFRRLRQRRLWKCTVRGGFVSLEITNRGNGWHPHLHIVADCEWLSLTTSPPTKWMSQDRKAHIFRQASIELENTWAELVGQKTASVAVRRKFGAAGAKNLAVETMKYTVKADDLIECEGNAGEVIHAMTKVRLFRGFGSCYRLKLDEEELKSPTPCECGAVGCWRPEELAEKIHVAESRDENGNKTGWKKRVLRR